MTDSNKTASEEFRWHFKSLQDDRHQVRMVGRRPQAIETIAIGAPKQVYSGRDAQEALRHALAWNSEGLNIEFEMPALKDCAGCIWLGLQAHVNYIINDRFSILNHVMRINRESFQGKANILEAGPVIWFFIRLPANQFKNVTDSLGFMKSVADYSANLGIKWDRSTDENLAFSFDAVDFFPFAGMPAAGMLRHDVNNSYRTGWINNREESPPAELIERISEALDCQRIMEQDTGRHIGPDAMRNASLMRLNEKFNYDVFFRLLEENAYFRKIVCRNNEKVYDGDRIEAYFDLILFLRWHWSVGPAIIDLAISERCRYQPVTSQGRLDFQRIEVLRAMLVANRCIDLVLARMKKEIPVLGGESTIPENLSFIPTSFKEYSLNEVLEELSPKYGQHLHCVSNGWFILDGIGVPDMVIHVREHPSRVRPYIPFPCNYKILANMEIQGAGALLVPNKSALQLWRLVCRKDTGDMAAAIYFWHYGTRFAFDWVPRDLIEDENGLFHRVMTWLAANRSPAWKAWKAHAMEHARPR